MGYQIKDFTEKTAPQLADLIEIQDQSGTGGTVDESYKVTLGTLLTIITLLTGKATPVGADQFVLYDSVGLAAKKVTLTELLAVIFGSDITLADGVDIATNATTGTKIATLTTQKLGFWGAAPVVQQAGANQAALTNSTGGTYNGTLEAVGATNGSDVSAAINNNFTELHTLLNEIRTVLVTTGLMKGSA